MRFKGNISLILCICLLLSITLIPASARTMNDDQSKTDLIESAAASIDVGLLQTHVIGRVQGHSSVVRVKITLELQKYSGGSYSTIKTWTETYNSSGGSLTRSKMTSPLETYRLKATFSAYTSTSSETKVIYTYDN